MVDTQALQLSWSSFVAPAYRCPPPGTRAQPQIQPPSATKSRLTRPGQAATHSFSTSTSCAAYQTLRLICVQSLSFLPSVQPRSRPQADQKFDRCQPHITPQSAAVYFFEVRLCFEVSDKIRLRPYTSVSSRRLLGLQLPSSSQQVDLASTTAGARTV